MHLLFNLEATIIVVVDGIILGDMEDVFKAINHRSKHIFLGTVVLKDLNFLSLKILSLQTLWSAAPQTPLLLVASRPPLLPTPSSMIIC